MDPVFQISVEVVFFQGKSVLDLPAFFIFQLMMASCYSVR